MTRFHRYRLSAVDEDYVTPDFHFDVATETCPTQASHVASSVPRPDAGDGRGEDAQDSSTDTGLWKRCCLQSLKVWMQQLPAKESNSGGSVLPFQPTPG